MFAMLLRLRIALFCVLAVAGSQAALLLADELTSAEPLEQARVHLQKGRTERALEIYQDLAKADKPEVGTVIGLSRAYESVGEFDKAETVVADALKATDNNAELLARFAELQFLQGRYREALATVEQVLRIDANQPLARLVQADALTETGQIDDAAKAYAWFVSYYNRQQPRDAETLLLVARGALQHARWQRSSGIFSFVVNTLCPDVLQADEHRWQASYLSGSLLLEKYNRVQALPEFRSALAINPRSADVLTALGEAALQHFDTEKATLYLDQALEINPAHVTALQQRADLELHHGRPDRALEILSRALAVNPADQRTLARMAACYLIIDGIPADDRLDQLLTNFDATDEVTLNNASRFEQLTLELAKRNPRPGPFLTIVARSLDGRRKFATAEKFYRHTIRVMPQLAEPKTELGMLYMRTGRTDEASAILDDAFEADSFHVRVSNMRKVLRLLNDYDIVTTKHFIIRLDPAVDKLLGQYMAEYLEEVYDELVDEFGFAPPARTQFEIYNDAKGLTAHQWFSARMVGLPWVQTIGASTGVMVALASPTAMEEPFNWARVLKHEFVHVVTLQQTRFNIPHWFTEALAVESENIARPEIWNQLLLERVPKQQLRNLDNIDEGFARAKTSDDWQFAYCQSHLYYRYIVDKYGKAAIPKLLDAYRDNLATAAAIKRVLQVDQAVFEAGYLEYLQGIVATINRGTRAPDKTLAELEQAYRANKDNPATMAAYAHGLLVAKQRRQARGLALAVLEKNPREPLAAVVMAELELRAQNIKAAQAYLEPALDRAKPHARILQLLAVVRVVENDLTAAAELYELGRQEFPYEVSWLKGLAGVYLKAGRVDRLRPVLEELARNDPDNAKIHKKLAELATNRGDHAEALRQATAALHVDVLDADVHRLLADANTALQDHTQAVREYEVALQLEPEDAPTALKLAKAYLAAGMQQKATQQLQRLKDDPQVGVEARQLLDRK